MRARAHRAGRLVVGALVASAVLASGVLISACGTEEPVPRQPVVVEPEAPVAPLERTLIWSDEFEAAAKTPIDASKWVHDVGGDGWGNEQLEFNTDRVDNAHHDGDGHLAIVARKETYRGRAYTSARINTQGRFSRQYGRIEARIRLPRGQGIWPAFWMLGGDFATAGWPDCGEIDIMEYRGQTPRESTGALHGPGYSAGQSIWGKQTAAGDLSSDFHVFAVEWRRGSIVWSVDDQVFHRVSAEQVPRGGRWAFENDFFIILNVAVGGTFVGSPNAATPFPSTMLVDYVRVYE